MAQGNDFHVTSGITRSRDIRHVHRFIRACCPAVDSLHQDISAFPEPFNNRVREIIPRRVRCSGS